MLSSRMEHTLNLNFCIILKMAFIKKGESMHVCLYLLYQFYSMFIIICGPEKDRLFLILFLNM